jgi:hypothetical protein
MAGAPKGNKNAEKGKIFEGALRMALAKNDWKALRQITDKTVELACEGEQWAVKEVMDRLDGKPKQAIEQTIDASVTFDAVVKRAEELRAKLRGSS